MVKELTVGQVGERCCILIDDVTKAGFIIDPGDDADIIAGIVRQNKWTIEKILLTHGHFDHMGAASELSVKLGATICAYYGEELFLTNPDLNLSRNFGNPCIIEDFVKLDAGEVIHLNADPEYSLLVIHTPGHTPGSVAYYCEKEKSVFVGDTLIQHGPGMTHFPGGNFTDLKDSIISRILTLQAETMIYSGHSTPITVGEERRILLDDKTEQK